MANKLSWEHPSSTSLWEKLRLWQEKYTLPFLAKARAQGYRCIDDLLEVFNEERAKVFPTRKKYSRSSFYRLLKSLQEQGLDPGPDDRSTARKYGHPTRGLGAGKKSKLKPDKKKHGKP